MLQTGTADSSVARIKLQIVHVVENRLSLKPRSAGDRKGVTLPDAAYARPSYDGHIASFSLVVYCLKNCLYSNCCSRGPWSTCILSLARDKPISEICLYKR